MSAAQHAVAQPPPASRWGSAWRHPAAGAAMAAAASLGVLWFGPTARGFTTAFFLAVLVPLALIDLERRILPNAIVLPATVVVLGAEAAFDPGRAPECAIAAVAAAALLLVLFLVSREGMGMGDVKLALLLGAGLGTDVVAALLIGSLLVWPYGLYLFARDGRSARKAAIPFGPFLAVGAFAAAILVTAGLSTASPLGRHSAATPKHSGLRAPSLESPRNGLASDSIPAFTWTRVRGAAVYEFQLSADGAFRSIVLGEGKGSFQTKNTAATITQALQDGDYFWRVRAVDANGGAGPWSRTRTLRKGWSQTPALEHPARDAAINYPDPVVLSWSAVPRAFKYQLEVATDPALGSPATGFAKPIETSGTDFAIGLALGPGRYYWAVTPLDAQRHKGQRSAVGSFEIAWPSATATRVEDLNADDRVYDPQVSWDPVPGAARYEVEINSSDDFAPGSRVCCGDPTTGVSLSPTKVLPNNTGLGGGYFWRVRGIDVDGNAGVWNRGPSFPKYFSPTSIASVPNLHVQDQLTSRPQVGIPRLTYPVVAWEPAPGAASYEIQVAPVTQLISSFQSAAGTTISVGSTTHMAPDSTITFANGDSRQITSIASESQLVVDSPLSSSPATSSAVTTSSGLCNWTPSGPAAAELWTVRTAATAWTPLSPSTARSPLGAVVTSVATDGGRGLVPGHSYCARVRARGDRDADSREVVSAWTELGDFLDWKPSFEYAPGPAPSCAASTATQASDYLTPSYGEVTPRMPFFAWKPVPGACSYFVVVAKDQSFTDVVDLALTRNPVYAPRAGTLPRTYADESSSYFWAVIPSPQLNGAGVWTKPEDNSPQEFHKRSVPPRPIEPVGGAAVTRQPTFRWTSADGAREYRLQVAQDPSFGEPIDDVLTDATAFTSSSTYPADTVLYWRVRADDENRLGLAWSPVQTFRRQLPTPQPSGDNPTGGRTIPLLRWSPVEGAVSYDIHIDQPNGSQKDFNLRSPAFTPIAYYGTGIWHWKVRANFPKVASGSTPGPYSERQEFTRFIGSPAGARGVANGSRMLMSWDPVEMAKSYRVEISASNSFSAVIDRVTTDNTSYAPRMTQPAFGQGGRLYWRVASLDEGNNAGGFTTGTFSLPKQLRVKVSGALRRGRHGAIVVTVSDPRGGRIRKAKVRATGAGLRSLAKRTTKRGTVVFRLRPRRGGKVVFQASKGGYRSGSATLKVA